VHAAKNRRINKPNNITTFFIFPLNTFHLLNFTQTF
jgi:hypothetical protein